MSRSAMIWVVSVCVCLLMVCGACERVRQQRMQRYYEHAKALYEQGQFRAAEKQFENAHEFGVSNAELLVLWAMNNYKMQNFQKAANLFRQAAVRDPDNIDILLLRYQSLMRIGRYQKVYFEIRDGSFDITQNDELYYLYAKAGVRLRRNLVIDRILAELEQRCSENCSDARLACLLAEIYLLRGREALALQWLARGKHSPDAWRETMQVFFDRYRSEGRHDEAVAMYEEIIAQSSNPFVEQQKLLAYLQSTVDLERQIVLLQQMVSEHPDGYELWIRLADALIAIGDDPQARRVIRRGIESVEESVILQSRLIRMTEIPAEARALAEQYMERYSEDSPERLQIQVALAAVYLKAGDYVSARAICQSIKEVSSRYLPNRELEAQIALQQGRLVEAIGLFRLLVEQNPENPDNLYFLGIAHTRNGDAIIARHEFNMLLDRRPGYKPALLALEAVSKDTRDRQDLLRRAELFLGLQQDLEVQKLAERLRSMHAYGQDARR